MSGCLTVEIANIGVLCGANDTISVVENFIALAIIAEFDNYVFSSMKNESFRELIEKRFTSRVLRISHTTSKKCSDKDMSDQVDDDGNLRPMKVTFGSRPCCNKCLFSIYKFMRTGYVSVFYYFLPFTAIVMSTLMPFFFREKYT